VKDARDPVRIFVGVDPRQPVAFTTLADSIYWRASRPVAITPLVLKQLPIKRRGLTDFTFSRFLVPWLCDFKGSAIFMDADILVMGDITELEAQANSAFYDVQLMKEQPMFEWPSVILFNNARCRKLTPEFIDNPANKLYDLAWAKDIGSFSQEWNRCVGYEQHEGPAKLYHFTQGIPCWPETKGNHPFHDQLWLRQHIHANGSVPWKDLMAGSVHADSTLKAYRARTNPVEMVNGRGEPVANQ
jgi:hypothetical protein